MKLVVIVILGVLTWLLGYYLIPGFVAFLGWLSMSGLVLFCVSQPTRHKDEDMIEQSPIVMLANAIIHEAIVDKAGSVTIQPQTRQACVIYDAETEKPVEAMIIPKNIQDHLVGRLKIMANMNPLNRRSPQSGRVEVAANGGGYLVRGETFFVEISPARSQEEGFRFTIEPIADFAYPPVPAVQ